MEDVMKMVPPTTVDAMRVIQEQTAQKVKPSVN